VLRKLAFTPQTFEDLAVEKEVAVRRRIAKEYAFFELPVTRDANPSDRFNKRRDDFPDLRSYNDYLEEVEDISAYRRVLRSCPRLTHSTAFNLIHDIDIPQTEARIAAYRAENAVLIELNIQREEQYAQSLREQEDQDRRERELRGLEARRLEEEEREEREDERRRIIDKLETSDKDAAQVIARTRANALKKTQARTSAAVSQSTRLLRSRAQQSSAIPDPPHVPLQDDWYTYEDMFVMRDKYLDPFSEAVRQDREGIMMAGGYRVEEAWRRALRSAVAGLDTPPLVGLDTPALELKGDIVTASA
jgi:CDK-activating kinase assembly factor MAT1